MSYKNDKLKISAPTWNGKFELPDGLYFVFYSRFFSKSWSLVTDILLIEIYVNQIENKITFRIKAEYYLELLTPKTMELLGSIKSKIN